MEEGKCRSCGAPVTWIVTEKGKRCPLNQEQKYIAPQPGGKAWGFSADGVTVKGEWCEADHPEAIKVHESHYRTCPQATQWSRKGKC